MRKIGDGLAVNLAGAVGLNASRLDTMATSYLVRWEYHAQNFLGFVQLACLVVLFRRF